MRLGGGDPEISRFSHAYFSVLVLNYLWEDRELSSQVSLLWFLAYLVLMA
jgi:hypothetical protein